MCLDHITSYLDHGFKWISMLVECTACVCTALRSDFGCFLSAHSLLPIEWFFVHVFEYAIVYRDTLLSLFGQFEKQNKCLFCFVCTRTDEENFIECQIRKRNRQKKETAKKTRHTKRTCDSECTRWKICVHIHTGIIVHNLSSISLGWNCQLNEFRFSCMILVRIIFKSPMEINWEITAVFASSEDFYKSMNEWNGKKSVTKRIIFSSACLLKPTNSFTFAHWRSSIFGDWWSWASTERPECVFITNLTSDSHDKWWRVRES